MKLVCDCGQEVELEKDSATAIVCKCGKRTFVETDMDKMWDCIREVKKVNCDTS